MDRNLPKRIESYIPEAKLYTELQELEKKVDAAISRKRLEVQESLGKPVKVMLKKIYKKKESVCEIME